MATRDNNAETVTQEKRGVERAESAINKSPSNPSPFLNELSSITGPNSGIRSIKQLDKDGFTGRAEALTATKILDETKGYFRNLPFQDNKLSRGDIEGYSKRANLGTGEQELSKRLLKDFDQISGDGRSITTDDIKKFGDREKQHADVRNMYAQNPKDGKSLYDLIKSDTGGISGEKLDKRLQDPTLSHQDKASLEAVNKLRGTTWGIHTGDVSSGALKNAADDARITQQEKQSTIKRAEPRSADAQAGQAALSDLTVRPNGGTSLLDRVSNGNGGLSLQKINDLGKNPERNNLTEQNVETLKYLHDHAPVVGSGRAANVHKDYSIEDMQKLASDSGQNWNRLASRPERSKTDEGTRGREQDFAHLLERNNGKPSLYDRLKSEDGGISNSRINEELKKPLDTKDRHTLDYLKSLSADSWGGLSRNDFSAADLVDKAHQHNVGDRQLRRGGLDAAPKPIERSVSKDSPTDRDAATTLGSELPQNVHKALKVGAGEGYWHSAERLLTEAHKGQRYEPTQAELKTVVNQLIAANGNRKELRLNEELLIDQTVRANPALAGLFK